MLLPSMKINVGRNKVGQIAFGGYDHNAVVAEGGLYDMANLSASSYPALSPRRGRTLTRTLGKANGLHAHEKLCWVDGTGFYYDGVLKGSVTDGEKQMVSMGVYVLIFPDKAYYNTALDQFGSLEATWTGTATFTHHTYDASSGEAGAVYQGNAITTTGAAFPFTAGEAVVITGAAVAGNNRTPVIREILDGGKKLVFTNNTFAEGATEALTLKRTVPDMEHFCENENRLWGCKGSQIYASALGNPFRWNNLEGLATDSYAATVGSPGAFTGACAYMGYPIFFKEDHIYKMYGSKPSNYQLMPSADNGVKAGAAKSLAIAGETLFYLGRGGMMAYTGGVPTSIARAFGDDLFASAVAGSDGTRYWVCLRKAGETAGTLFCYDPRSGQWHKEDDVAALRLVRYGGLVYLLEEDGKLWTLETAGPENVAWMAETGDFTDNGPDKTRTVRLQVRLELEEGSTMYVSIQFDSDGVWRPVKELSSTHKRSFLLPIIPRRCDHYRLRMSGQGECRVFGLTREYDRGSAL